LWVQIILEGLILEPTTMTSVLYFHKATGYRYSRNEEGAMVYEHRINASIKIGRKLKSGEVVHHIDENKENNNLDNLLVFKTEADHTRFHNLTEEKRELLQLADGAYICRQSAPKNRCQYCNALFRPTVTRSGDKAQKCCSKKCAALLREQESVKPTKEVLINLLKQHSFLAIGAMYNVSDNAVRKWCKTYDIPYKLKDIKLLRSNN
jgi:HNH endonuclease